MFNRWCEENGVLMPKLEYPAYFDDGLIGVRCKEDIQHREAFLFVPYKIMMCTKKAQNDLICGPIILDHPYIFNESFANTDWEQFTLTLFIFSEMVKGKESFYYPYLRTMPDVEFSASWDEHVIEMFQDEEIEMALAEYEAEIKAEWEKFKKVLEQYPKIFPAKFVDRELFNNIYG